MHASGVDALFARLAADLPDIPWTREPQFLTASTPIPLGIVTGGRAERANDPQDPPLWREAAPVIVYIQRTETQDLDMLSLVDRVDSALAPHAGEQAEGYATTLDGAVVAAWLSSFTLGHAPDPNTASVAVMLEVNLLY